MITIYNDWDHDDGKLIQQDSPFSESLFAILDHPGQFLGLGKQSLKTGGELCQN